MHEPSSENSSPGTEVKSSIFTISAASPFVTAPFFASISESAGSVGLNNGQNSSINQAKSEIKRDRKEI